MRRALSLALAFVVVGAVVTASTLTGLITLPPLDLASFLAGDRPAAAPGEAPATPSTAGDARAALPAGADRLAFATPDARPRTKLQALKIEVARIDPDGASVLAGRAPADSRVTIYANGEAITSATASNDGQWSAVITKRFPPGPVELAIAAEARTVGSVRSATVTLIVPKGSGLAELTVAPDRPRPIPPKAAPGDSHALGELAALVERARSSSSQTGENGARTTDVVPVPITFVTGEATMTPEGLRAADLLVEYVRIMAPKAMTLSGHADVRGGDVYNIELSRLRLEAIEHHLRNHGYTGRLALLPKGKSEPFTGIDRHAATLDAVLQADRRVELRFVE
jgi:outer membrane protein OmpA-like peptidoglycan-associated protein